MLILIFAVLFFITLIIYYIYRHKKLSKEEKDFIKDGTRWSFFNMRGEPCWYKFGTIWVFDEDCGL